MTLRQVLALVLVTAATPVLAQPAPLPAPTPAPGAALKPSGDEMAEFEKELDALFAQGGLTAEQAAQRARKVSPAVKRSAASIEVSIAQAQAAELSRVPQVGVTASYSRLSPIDVPEIMFGGMSFGFPVFYNQYLLQARATVNVSDYFTRYPKIIEAAKLGMEVTRASQRSSELGAEQEARLAYWEWVRARLGVLIARRQYAQVQTTLAQVRALAEVQRLSRADLMRVESNEAEAEQQLIQLQNVARLREEQLRILIDAPPSEPLSIGEDIRGDVAAPGPGPLDPLVATAKQQRPDFKVFDIGIRAKEKQREAEKAGLYPRLSAFATADYANPNQRIFPLEDKFNLTWVLGAQVTWTLNETLLARTTDRRLRGETNELRADRESLERGIRVEILAAQQAVAIAAESLGSAQKGLAAAEEGYRVRRELLNAQRATAVELVDAETELTRARVAALSARVNLRIAMVQLDHALGNDAK